MSNARAVAMRLNAMAFPMSVSNYSVAFKDRKLSSVVRSAWSCEFFRAVAFEAGSEPAYGNIHALFIELGILIKNTSPTPEISSVHEFIEPRRALVSSGALTRFHESELFESTVIFGNVAHRFSAYKKCGTSNGVAF